MRISSAGENALRRNMLELGFTPRSRTIASLCPDMKSTFIDRPVNASASASARPHLGHDDVYDEKVDWTRLAGNDLERGLATGGVEHAVPLCLEQRANDPTNRGIVFHDEHGLRPARQELVRRGGRS